MAEIYEQMQERWPPTVSERFSEKTGKRLKDEIITFNPGSRKQIGEKLIELGWKPQKLTPTGQPLVDEDTLRGVLFPEGQIIADYFLLQKRIAQIESWLEAMGPDGRVHGKVITNGAVTGRATHSKPNMAQVPATKKDKDGNILYGIEGGYGVESRKCWTVETGNVLVGIDLSGIELRCFAHYLNDPEYTNEVVNGDVHTKNQKAFGVATRSEAKTVLYASLYGASASKIGRIVGGTEQTGKGILDSFRRNVPAFAELQRKVSRYAAKGWLPGLDGRRLLVRSEHSALNTLLQSAGAIIAKRWIVETTKKLNEAKIPYKLVAWVHDELQIETSPGHASTVGRIAVEAAERSGIFLNFRCPVAAEWKSGNNWFDCH
jgi:DNA polymerase I-like protein with 3'-5' exonuclease and polymerase domains